MHSEQLLLPFAAIPHDIHMGILNSKAMQNVHEDLLHREFYSDDSGRFLFCPPLPLTPSIPPLSMDCVSKCNPPISRPILGQDSSSGHSQSNSASDEPEDQNPQQQQQQQHSMIDERKQRRMLSNRESARRSRMRKQKHLDELRAQVAHMRNENRQILSRLELVSRSYNQVLEENRLLKSQAVDLSRQLHQLQQALASSQSAASFAASFNSNSSIQIDDIHPTSRSDLLI